ncbi:hypothetical protein TNCV_22851 [Trichonephila clavipes]|nr:hypothetical protein TNCV_22851 [Trichonephila clavipes]
MTKTKLSGATAHRGPRPIVPISAFLAIELHKQMFQPALKTTRPELTLLRILWDLEQEEENQQDDVENDLKTLNIKNWQRVAVYRWNWRKRAVEAAKTCNRLLRL